MPSADREGTKAWIALPRSRRLGLNRSSTSPRRGREKAIFWDTLFGPYPSWREEKVLEYVVHRLGAGTPKGRDARGVRPPPRLPRRGRRDSRQPQAHLGAPKEDGGEPFFRQARPEEAHQARGRDRRRVVAKTSLTVIQRAQAPCKTTVEKPRRSCRGFSLS